jgi:twitching motility protein PilU
MDEIKDAMGRDNEVGMRTFDQSLFDLYQAGRLSKQEALGSADSHTGLSLRFELSEDANSGEVPPS